MDVEQSWANSSCLCCPREESNNEMLLDNDDDNKSVDSFHTAYSSDEEDEYAMPLRGGDGQATTTSNNNHPPRVSTGAAPAAALPLLYAPGAFHSNPNNNQAQPARVSLGQAPVNPRDEEMGGDGDDPMNGGDEVVESTKVERLTHPFEGISVLQNGEYTLREKGSPDTHLTAEEQRTRVTTWLQTVAESSHSISTNKKIRKGNCLSFLADKPIVIEAVGAALIQHFRQAKVLRNRDVAHDYRVSKHLTDPSWDTRKGAQRTFVLPLYYETVPDDAEARADLKEANEYLITLSGWTTLFNKKQKALKTVGQVCEGVRGMQHGNTGKSVISEPMQEAYTSIKARLTHLQTEYATPFATKYVRDTTGQVSTREDTDRVTLPPYFAWKRVFYDWVASRGRIVEFKDRCKTIYKPIKEWGYVPGFFPTQEEADAYTLVNILNGSHLVGQVAKSVCSERSFQRYRTTHFPKLVIRKRGEDTCDDCHGIMLKLQHLKRKEAEATKKIEAATNSASGAAGGEANDAEDTSDGTTPSELMAFRDQIQAEIDLVEHHILQADTQREKYVEFHKQAKEDIENNVEWKERTIFLVIDMAQNGFLPMLLGEQMGSIYYMSELIHLIFGVAEPATEHMRTFIWEEGQAARGANNIISCLYQDLVKRGVVDLEGEKCGEDALGHLVIAADNCSGQNKNKAMISFCLWLVEAGHAKKVTLMFLIKGHTKNHCDKYFNLLKKGTRGRDIWTAHQLDEAYTMNNAKYISLYRLNDKPFYDWAKGLQKIYKDLPPSSLLCNHEFTFGGDVDDTNLETPSKTTYRRKEFCGSDVGKSCDLMPSIWKRAMAADPEAVSERKDEVVHLPNNLDHLPAPGLRAIKANECQNKLGPLAPPEFRWYYQRLTNELETLFKEERKRKRQQKLEAQKKRQQEIDTANADNTD